MLAKVGKAVKEFFKGALKAMPFTMIASGLAFAASAALGHYTGFNPLHIEGSFGDIAQRWVGSVLIGSSISGVVHSYKAMTSDCEPEATPAMPPRELERSRGRSREIGGEAFTPSFTPPVEREGSRARHNA